VKRIVQRRKKVQPGQKKPVHQKRSGVAFYPRSKRTEKSKRLSPTIDREKAEKGGESGNKGGLKRRFVTGVSLCN